MKQHNWQIHENIRVCEDCGVTRHVDRMHDLPPCDPTEMNAVKRRLHDRFMQKLAERYPDHPWVNQ